MKLNPLSAALLGAGIAVVGTAGAIDLPHWLKGEPQVAAATQQPAPAEHVVPAVPAVPFMPARQVPNYRAIVKQSAPAVVGVTVEGTHKMSAEEGGLPDGMENDPFFKFFRGMPGFSQRGLQQGPQATPFKGLGSGFIVSSNGLILTNAHVVREAKDVTVKLSDRREYTAKVLGVDTTTDIAVLKIDAKDLPVVRLGDSKSLKVGDPVLAIGAPYGLEETATAGIVSAKGRSLPGDAVVPFIQTDAAVNPGNSGGPLFDGTGSVVGINAQIYSRSGGFQGVSFAIPIDVALKREGPDRRDGQGLARQAWCHRAGPQPDAGRLVRHQGGGRGIDLQRRARQRRRRSGAEVGRRHHRGERSAGRRLGQPVEPDWHVAAGRARQAQDLARSFGAHGRGQARRHRRQGQ